MRLRTGNIPARCVSRRSSRPSRCSPPALRTPVPVPVPPPPTAWSSRYLARRGLPSVAAAVFVDGTLVYEAARGTRRAGESVPVSLRDPYHIGSDTKAMTAVLAGMLVDEGKMRWETTVADLLGPEAVRACARGNQARRAAVAHRRHARDAPARRVARVFRRGSARRGGTGPPRRGVPGIEAALKLAGRHPGTRTSATWWRAG